jgi:hypothetical protein
MPPHCGQKRRSTARVRQLLLPNAFYPIACIHMPVAAFGWQAIVTARVQGQLA